MNIFVKIHLFTFQIFTVVKRLVINNQIFIHGNRICYIRKIQIWLTFYQYNSNEHQKKNKIE